MNRKVFRSLVCGVAAVVMLSVMNDAAAQVSPPAAYSNSQVNYVRTWTATAPEASGDALISRPLKDVKQTTQYLDGLGRPIQTVVKQGSLETGSAATDMVSAVVYDEYGRERYKYLPFVSAATTGVFKTDPFQQQAGFMAAQYGAQGETYFYGRTDFEYSQLNRPLVTYAPGNSWVGSTRGVAASYWHNTSTDNVKIWKVDDVANAFGTYSINTAINGGVYPAGVLLKNGTTDEHGKQVLEFKDKEGKVILKKVQLTASPDDGSGRDYTDWLCTYYIYDDLNNLRCVIQPEGVKWLAANSWQLTADLLTEQCFRYEYDKRNRMIMKKVPGAGEVYMVYDGRDRLVMTQDANLRGGSPQKWLVTKYDALNRPIETGLWNNNGYNFATHLSLAYGTTIDYPDTWTGYELLTVTHYDNYTGLPAGLSAAYLSTWNSYFAATNNSAWPYPQMPQKSELTKGLVTWTQAKVLGSSPAQYISSVNIYDAKGRVIQVQSTNITNAADVLTTQYNWAGQPLVTVQKQQKDGTNAQTTVVVTQMTYDDLGRLVKTEKKQSNTLISENTMSNYKTIAQLEYDKLGQLKTKKLGTDPNNSAAPLETMAYEYNIRGWMLGANRGFASNANNNNWFGFDLGYDKAANGISNYANPQYNGNIEGMLWRGKSDGVVRKYNFYYDAANRLLRGDYQQVTNYTAENFDVKMGDGVNVSSAYDANGNIKRMQQWGWKLTGSVQIDDLNYSYFTSGGVSSNKLQAVNDVIGGDNKLGDFTDKNTTATDYGYDKNGNLVTDLNKRINGSTGGEITAGGAITYNHLNLPVTIGVKKDDGTDKGTITYTYDAAGNKLKKTVAEIGQATKTTLYINGAVYENDALQFIGHEEGRIRYTPPPPGNTWGTLNYDYMLKDHLGNVRVLLTEEQKSDMYPPATMEPANATTEETFYSNLPATRADVPSGYTGGYPQKASKVRGDGNKIGAAIVLKVMAGDKYSFQVNSWYTVNKGTTPGNPVSALSDLANALSNGLAGVNSGKATASELNSTGLSNTAANSFLSTQSYDGAKPKAFINWILLDEQFRYYAGGFEQVQGSGAYPLHNRTNQPVTKSGYLYIYVSNETPNIDVFFDNLQVTHVRGPLLEETSYYPFGLTMVGIENKSLNFGSPANKRKFIGKELQNNEFSDGSGLEWYDLAFRTNDPQLGRFLQIDPISHKYLYNTPYAYAENRVTIGIDIEGLELFITTAPVIASPSTTTLTRLIPITLESNNVIPRTSLVEQVLKTSGEISKTTSKIEEHHIIPTELKNNPIVEMAREGGFKFEGKENKMPLEKFSRLTGEGQHGSHPKYTSEVMERIAKFQEDNPSAGPKQSVEFLRNLVKDLQTEIESNPGTKVNDLFKGNLHNGMMPTDNTGHQQQILPERKYFIKKEKVIKFTPDMMI